VISGRATIGTLIRRGAKSIALLAATVVLAAQFLALAHFHQRNASRQFNGQSQVVADDGLCALCLLAFHAPLNPAATPSIVRPFDEPRLLDFTVTSLHVSIPSSACRTRSPPVAFV
jgi:hypothetical protein